MIINPATKAAAPALEPGDTEMRTLSFIILAFGFVLAGASVAGSSDKLPGIGTFAFGGSPIAASHAIVVAAR